MASGSIYGTTSNQYIQSCIDWVSTPINKDNKSKVKAELWYRRTNSWSGTPTSGTGTFGITIGEASDSTTFSLTIHNGGTWVKAIELETTVDHNYDGSKSVYISGTGSIPVASLSSTTCAGTVELDKIPRQANITSSQDFTDLDNPTVYYNNPAGNAVDSLMACLSFTGAKDDIPYRSIPTDETSYQFVLTEEERNILRNNTINGSRNIIFYVRTVIGGVTYYSTDTKTFTVAENDDTRPTVTMTATLNNASLPSEFASKFDGMYIQGKSRLDVKLSAEGKYSASILSYSAKIGEEIYNSDSFLSNVLNQDGTVKIIGYAKDSRQFTGSTEQEIDVITYSKPLVIPLGSETAIQCYRSDGNGVRIGNSTSVWIKAKMTHYSVSGQNQCALQWRKKLVADVWNDSIHEWGNLIDKTNDTAIEYNALIPNVEFNLRESYSVQIRAIDDIGEYDIKEFEIPTQDVALHLGAGGTKVSIGTYCDGLEDYTFYSDWKAIFDKGIYGTHYGASSGALLNQNVTDVLEFPKDCTDGITPIIINASTNKDNLPEGNYDYSVGIIHKRAADQYNVILMDYVTGKIAINVCLSGTWTGWKYITPQ